MSEPREFWVDPLPCDEDIQDVFDAFLEHPRQGPLQWQGSLVRVIEYAAYAKLKSRLEEAEFTLKRIAAEPDVEATQGLCETREAARTYLDKYKGGAS